MKSTAQNTWPSRYGTTTAVVFIIITVTIAVIEKKTLRKHRSTACQSCDSGLNKSGA